MKIAIIIPAYNEELTIRDTILDFFKQKPNLFFVIVNNNSKDRTFEIASETLKSNSINGVVITEKRQGKGYAVRRAFQDIDADYFVMIDADTTYKACDLENMLAPVINNEADMTVGNRHFNSQYALENKRSFHNFGNNLVKFLINFLFKSQLQDILSGYRVFNRKFVKLFPLMSTQFELETELTLHCLDKRYRILEIPITYVDRPEGSFSKLNTYKDGIKVLLSIFNIFRFYRPLAFFSYIALITLTLSILCGAPVIYEFIQTRFIAHIPLAILATGLALVSALTFAIGVILDSIIRINKQNYELTLSLFEHTSQK